MSNTGSQRERDFVGLANEIENVSCIRLAASGGGTVEELPDVLLVIDTDSEYILVAGEMKYAEDGTERKYVQSREIEELMQFSQNWGAIPVVIHRWARDTNFYVIPLRPLTESDYTRTGNLSLSKEERRRSMEFEQYVRILEKS